MRIKHKFFTIVLFLIVLTTALYILIPDNNLHKKKIGDLFTKNIISENLVIRKIEIKGVKKLSKKSILFSYNIEKIRYLLSDLFNISLFPEEIYFLSKMPSEIDFNSILIITLCSLAITVLVSIFPSYSASKLDPIKALKYE